MVLDASVSIAWLFDDERTDAVSATLARVDLGEVAWVPSLWFLEVAHVLGRHVRKGKISVLVRNGFLSSLLRYDIRVDEHTAEYAWSETLRLADKHNLTPYDASYLELAIRMKQSLATLDADLRTAATSEGVPLLGL